MKLEKLLGDNEYLRGLLKTVEAKIDEEVNKRLRHEFENKQWIERTIGIFRDEIVNYCVMESNELKSKLEE